MIYKFLPKKIIYIDRRVELQQLTLGLAKAWTVLASPLNKSILVVRLGRKLKEFRRPSPSPNVVRNQASVPQWSIMIFPKIYLDFCKRFKRSIPANLVGTDFAGTSGELKEGAIELLEENQIKNFLTDDDFVFLMHQGYVFGYFRADGQPDPDVHIFTEGNVQSENKGSLSKFLKAYE